MSDCIHCQAAEANRFYGQANTTDCQSCRARRIAQRPEARAWFIDRDASGLTKALDGEFAEAAAPWARTEVKRWYQILNPSYKQSKEGT